MLPLPFVSKAPAAEPQVERKRDGRGETPPPPSLRTRLIMLLGHAKGNRKININRAIVALLVCNKTNPNFRQSLPSGLSKQMQDTEKC